MWDNDSGDTLRPQPPSQRRGDMPNRSPLLETLDRLKEGEAEEIAAIVEREIARRPGAGKDNS